LRLGLGAEWYNRVVDVCGLRRPEGRVEVFLTHAHRDHLILPPELKGLEVLFWVPNETLWNLVRRTYPGAKVEIWEDTIRFQHTSLARGRYEKVKTYGYFVGRVTIIPECDDPFKAVREYRGKTTILMIFKRSPRFCQSKIPTEEVDYFLDPSCWFFENRDPKVIPKVFFSSTPQDQDLFKRLRVGEKRLVFTGGDSF